MFVIGEKKCSNFYNKINEPEKFDLIPNDDGSVSVKELKPLEKSWMPWYGLEDKEITSLVTLIMGLVKDEIPPTKLPEKTPQYLAVTKGEQFIHTNNCLGCHKIDGEGGAIWPSTAVWLEEIAGSQNSEDMSIVQSFSPPLLKSIWIKGNKFGDNSSNECKGFVNLQSIPSEFGDIYLSIAYLKNADVTFEEINQIIKGPDFEDPNAIAASWKNPLAIDISDFRIGYHLNNGT